MFDRFTFSSGLANGFNSFVFDPDYRRNGRFYTVHIEEAGADRPGLSLFVSPCFT